MISALGRVSKQSSFVLNVGSKSVEVTTEKVKVYTFGQDISKTQYIIKINYLKKVQDVNRVHYL